MVDDAPDAEKVDLCYRVDAISATGTVIRAYEPMYVPKYAPRKK